MCDQGFVFTHYLYFDDEFKLHGPHASAYTGTADGHRFFP